jgi:hypothetical protein
LWCLAFIAALTKRNTMNTRRHEQRLVVVKLLLSHERSQNCLPLIRQPRTDDAAAMLCQLVSVERIEQQVLHAGIWQ